MSRVKTASAVPVRDEESTGGHGSAENRAGLGRNRSPSISRLHGFHAPTLIDTSERDAVFLLTTDAGRYLRFTGSAFHLLRMVNEGRSMEEIAARFSQDGDRHVTAEQVEAAHNRLMDRVQELDRTADPATFGLKWPRRIIRATTVQRVARFLTGVYRWPSAMAVVAGIACAIIIGLHERSLGGSHLTDVVLSNFWAGYALFLVSLVAHEFGHATACARFGARPAEIGVGIYFIYPALYSDVTDAWRLTRWQRALVDAGGVFFQAAVGAGFIFAFEVTGFAPLLAASVLVASNCLFSLNPLLKFDGYWLISDALGVTDIRTNARQVVRALWDRIRGHTTTQLRWSGGVAAAVLAFGAVVLATWVMFMVYVIPQLVRHIASYPTVAMTFGRTLIDGNGGITVSHVLNFLLTTYFAVIGVRVLYGQAARLWSFGLKRARMALRR
jgi:putative peptide zinc metalloprotease protein